MIQMKTVKKGETNMAMPFKPLSTEKLRNYFKKKIDQNCNNKETNQYRKNESDKISRIKLRRSGKHLETWIQRQINS
jgi:hypothetical protein